jgi:hypothetical protein
MAFCTSNRVHTRSALFALANEEPASPKHRKVTQIVYDHIRQELSRKADFCTPGMTSGFRSGACLMVTVYAFKK